MSFRRGKPMLMAIRPGGKGDVTETHVAWQLHRSIPEVPSPVFYKDRLCLVRNGGLLAAVDAANGAILYSEHLGAPGHYSASPVVANDHLYPASNLRVIGHAVTLRAAIALHVNHGARGGGEHDLLRRGETGEVAPRAATRRPPPIRPAWPLLVRLRQGAGFSNRRLVPSRCQ